MNKEDTIRKVLEHAKPDAMMMMEAIKAANVTIKNLMHQLQHAEAHWNEMFVTLGTVLNKYGREVILQDYDMIPLSPHDYKVTIEHDEETDTRIVRLRHIADTGEDNQPA